MSQGTHCRKFIPACYSNQGLITCRRWTTQDIKYDKLVHGVAPILFVWWWQVDHTGFSTVNPQRFGQKFVGRVANPHDMLTWHKAPLRRVKARTPAAQHLCNCLLVCCGETRTPC